MKKFEKIIKNIDKYDENIKPCFNVFLSDETKREFRYGHSGASLRGFGLYWFITPHGKAMFKTYDHSSLDYSKGIRKLNEVICYNLAKQMNFDCVNYEYAKYQSNSTSKDGLLSYNFLKPDETLLSLSEILRYAKSKPQLDFEGLNNIFNQAYFSNFKFDKEKIFTYLFQLVVFDTLTLQSDRNATNLSFICDKNFNLRPTPLYDNEFAFLSYHFGDSEPFENVVTVSDAVDIFYKKSIEIQSSRQLVGGLEVFENTIKQIVRFAKKNPYMDKIFKNMMKADLGKVYKNLESEGYTINDDYKNYTLALYNFTKKKLIKEYKRCKDYKNALELKTLIGQEKSIEK